MTKRLNAKKKISRKLGVALWGGAKDPYVKRNYRPGQHGQAMKSRGSDYGLQLRAKQRLRFYYGNISERQFHNIFKLAAKSKGDTSANFIASLESRLDAIVYRANFAPTVFAARQLINHKHFKVNGKSVNIPSYRLVAGDIVQIRDKSKNLNIILEALQKMERDLPAYLQANLEDKSVKLLSLPLFSDVPYPVEMQPHLITEFYSR